MIEAGRLSQRHLANVLTYFTHRITNAVAEGLNSKIATIQRRDCGLKKPRPLQDRRVLPLRRAESDASERDPAESRMNLKKRAGQSPPPTYRYPRS